MRIGHTLLFCEYHITLPKDFYIQENRSASSQALEDDRRGSEASAEPVLENVVSEQNIVVADNTTPAKPRRPDYREVRNGTEIKIFVSAVFHGTYVFGSKIFIFPLTLLAGPEFLIEKNSVLSKFFKGKIKSKIYFERLNY